MAPDQWKQAQRIFGEALECQPEERAGFLDEACGDNVALRSEVESLLEHHAEASSGFMLPVKDDPDATREPAQASQTSDPLLGQQIGDFHIRQLLGEGGFALVYKAQQTKPIRRTVALKLIKPGRDTKEVLARFEAERQALALMDHPNVAAVYDAGEMAGGRPYFVMEYVPGVPITDYCDRERLALTERLDLFIQVCEAVQHAHQRGVIHRDISPSNVLVMVSGERPLAKVIDFGIAKAMSQPLTAQTLFTEEGHLMGKPEYMAPEQAEMTGLNVDTRTDIYALGVMLYELLTGSLPFPRETLRRKAFDELCRTIREEEPPKPSTRLATLDPGKTTTIARARHTDARALHRQVRGDLDWITTKAMEKNRTRRYASASELGADVRRCLSAEPIVARPPSVGYRIQKFARRNRGVFVATASIAAVLILATVVSAILAVYANAKRREAMQAQENLAIALEREKEERERADWQSYVGNIVAAQASLQDNDVAKAQDRLTRAPERHRHWEWSYLAGLADQSVRTLSGHTGWVRSVAVSPDNARMASGGQDGTIRIWDYESGSEIAVLEGHKGPVRSVAWSPSGDWIASGSEDKTIRVWSLSSDRSVAVLRGQSGRVNAVAVSPDGQWIASGSIDSTIRLWNASSARESGRLEGHGDMVRCVAFSPDGTRLASGSRDNTVRIWSVPAKREELTIPIGSSVASVVFSPDGHRVAIGADTRIRLCDSSTGSELSVFEGHVGWIESVVFCPDGSKIASAAWDQTVRVWNTTGEEQAVLRGHRRWVFSVVFDAAGERLVSCSGDGTLKLWRIPSHDKPTKWLAHLEDAYAVEFVGKESLLVSGGGDGAVRLWDGRTGRLIRKLGQHQGAVRTIALDGTGSLMVSGGDDNLIRIWDMATGDAIRTLSAPSTAVAISSDGSRIASAAMDSVVRLWDTNSGQQLAFLKGHKAMIDAVAFHPDGTRLASASRDHTIRLWSAEQERSLEVLSSHTDWVFCLAFSPDGDLLASGSADESVILWDVSFAAPIRVLRGHGATRFGGGGVFSVTFSSDGARVASASKDGTVKIWSTDTGEELLTLKGPGGWLRSVCFDQESKRIACTGARGEIRVWEAEDD